MSILSKPLFHNEKAAFEYLESVLWPDGPVCPHCGVVEGAYKIAPNLKKKVRMGLWKCADCRKQFTVTVGTLFERSHVPLHKWLQATYLMCASKKAISAHQLHRILEVTYKTAWFMAHRIREGMREGFEPMGGNGKIVEADETYIGGKEKNKHVGKRKRSNIGGQGKEAVFSLVERGGKVRSHHVPSVSAKTLRPILVAQVDRKSVLMSDDAGQYRIMGPEFAKHEVVNHSIDEYVRGEAHTNTVEGYFSILKRGITGTYHHVSQEHLKRYLGEFDFRYNFRVALGYNDDDRTSEALRGIVGKRLTYRTAN